jgi:hypothetical protein
MLRDAGMAGRIGAPTRERYEAGFQFRESPQIRLRRPRSLGVFPRPPSRGFPKSA